MSTVLVIPDVHQNIKWINNILEKEAEKSDHIVLLGDFFDSHNPHKATAIETCEFLDKIRIQYKKLIVCGGNHDIHYLFFYPKAKKYQALRAQNCPFLCSGFTKNKAYNIAKTLSWDFVKDVKLAVLLDDVLYSHAGARPELFSYKPEGYDVKGFLKECQVVRDNLNNPEYAEHPFLVCGRDRGGWANIGGLTWCDESSFYESEGLPSQIFGHSRGSKPRKHGKSWCIDCGQTYYAIVTDGNAEFYKI